MDVQITNLRCRIASLETQLAHERQEKQTLHDTIVCLSKFLSGHNQKNHYRISGQGDTPSGIANRGTTVSQNLYLEPAQTQLGTTSDGQDNDEHDLIELSFPPADTTNACEQDSSFTPASDSREIQTGVNSTKIKDASFNINSTSFLADGVNQESNTASNDKPPGLDLRFRGLRTALDGPEKLVAKVNSSGTDESGQTLSFDEICGRTPFNEDKLINISRTSQTVSFANRLSYMGTKTRETFTNHDSTDQPNDYALNDSSILTKSSPSHDSSSTQSSERYRQPMSLSHGIRFQPKEINYSTRSRVMVFNLPKAVSALTILSKIRGGIVISCEILDTDFAYGGPSAMIRFSTHSEAMFCINHAATIPLVFEGRTASIQLVATPSYPLSQATYQNIFDHGHTRCLRVGAFQQIKHLYFLKKYLNPSYIEYQSMDDCGDWHVRFTSLVRASTFWADLRSYYAYNNSAACFMPDPCDVKESLDIAVCKNKDIKIMEGGVPDWKI